LPNAGSGADSPTDVVLAHTSVGDVPLLPSIRLRQATETFLVSETTEGDLAARGMSVPFWAFAWPGGIALARHLLAHPELVAGRRVLDIGTGSGLVAIAAAQAGAAEVIANDIDPLAIAAVELNAASNAVTITTVAEDVIGTPGHAQLERADVVVAGDIAYDRTMAEAAFRALRRVAARGACVYLGDPGRAYLPADGLTLLETVEVPVRHGLELTDVKRTKVWRMDHAGAV
jgi:predicted nicotinamide N-methyase